MPFDASPFPTEDPVHMLRAITMAFTILVSRQPHMMVEFGKNEFLEFPFECFRLSAAEDPTTGATVFMVVNDKDCEVKQ
jgi:hypothetical protein